MKQDNPNPLRVVLVEDSPVLRARLMESLEALGVNVVSHADTESEAVRQLETQDWDAVVLDLQLRQGNGIGVLRALRRSGAAAGRTIIVLTNYVFPQYRAKCEQLGANHFLDKSRDYDKLGELLMGIARG
jgi:DNA-binding NarL/FixJ family response regulator